MPQFPIHIAYALEGHKGFQRARASPEAIIVAGQPVVQAPARPSQGAKVRVTKRSDAYWYLAEYGKRDA